MVLHVLPDLETQGTNMLSHIQKRVIRQLRVLMSPLGSRAKMATSYQETFVNSRTEISNNHANIQ